MLVVASGFNRIDEKKVSALMGERVKSADAEYVTRVTGFVPGGVPPVGHVTPPKVFIDEDLRTLGELWAAGGCSNAVFKASFDELVALSGGIAADVAKRG